MKRNRSLFIAVNVKIFRGMVVESTIIQTNYEGTWEEILTHTSELKGKKVKLTVIDDTEQHQTGSIPVFFIRKPKSSH